jgi:hypothetical protein
VTFVNSVKGSLSRLRIYPSLTVPLVARDDPNPNDAPAGRSPPCAPIGTASVSRCIFSSSTWIAKETSGGGMRAWIVGFREGCEAMREWRIWRCVDDGREATQ